MDVFKQRKIEGEDKKLKYASIANDNFRKEIIDYFFEPDEKFILEFENELKTKSVATVLEHYGAIRKDLYENKQIDNKTYVTLGKICSFLRNDLL